MYENSPAYNRQMKRNSTIFLAAVVVMNIGYWGWRWATQETYEGCLKEAARSANGMPRAYADLREICEDREIVRTAIKLPAAKPSASQAGLFDDLPEAKPPGR